MVDSAGGYWRLKGLFFSDNWIWLFSGYGWFVFSGKLVFRLDMLGFSQDLGRFFSGLRI